MIRRYPETDILTLLPGVPVKKLERGSTIYEPGKNESLHLVTEGLVAVYREFSTTSPDRCIIDVYGPEDLFGETALALRKTNEGAYALSDCTVMSWPVHKIEELISLSHGGLGITLARFMAKRQTEMLDRIESLAHQQIPERLTKALLRFAERVGTTVPEGRLIPGFTHEFLAQYVGTARERISAGMAILRRHGLIDYSRNKILVRSALSQEMAA